MSKSLSVKFVPTLVLQETKEKRVLARKSTTNALLLTPENRGRFPDSVHKRQMINDTRILVMKDSIEREITTRHGNANARTMLMSDLWNKKLRSEVKHLHSNRFMKKMTAAYRAYQTPEELSFKIKQEDEKIIREQRESARRIRDSGGDEKANKVISDYILSAYKRSDLKVKSFSGLHKRQGVKQPKISSAELLSYQQSRFTYSKPVKLNSERKRIASLLQSCKTVIPDLPSRSKASMREVPRLWVGSSCSLISLIKKRLKGKA